MTLGRKSDARCVCVCVRCHWRSHLPRHCSLPIGMATANRLVRGMISASVIMAGVLGVDVTAHRRSVQGAAREEHQQDLGPWCWPGATRTRLRAHAGVPPAIAICEQGVHLCGSGGMARYEASSEDSHGLRICSHAHPTHSDLSVASDLCSPHQWPLCGSGAGVLLAAFACDSGCGQFCLCSGRSHADSRRRCCLSAQDALRPAGQHPQSVPIIGPPREMWVNSLV